MAKKFAVVIRKGGSGKTTTTTNLAAGLSQKGSRVLLVDIDSQANATKGVGLVSEDLQHTLNDVFAGRVSNVRDAIVPNSFGLHVLPGHRDLSQTEQGMVGNPDSLWRLKEVLSDDLSTNYSMLIYPFDVPRGTHVNHANSLGAPIVLYMPSHPAAVGYSKLVERIRNNG